MAGRFWFKWVAPSATSFDQDYAVMGEEIFAFTVSQVEGGFATLEIVVRNPGVGLLALTRFRWAWLSMGVPGSAVPLFFGRLAGVPGDWEKQLVKLTFLARPSNYATLKAALAETLKVAPYWDEAFIDEQRGRNPDAVLEGRNAEWHVDRVSHATTISDRAVGEDGMLSFGPGDILENGIAMSIGEVPLRRVDVEIGAAWDQTLFGDFSVSTGGGVSTYTGQGLYDSWPKAGGSGGNGWTIAASTVTVADGKSVKKQFKRVWVDYLTRPEDPPDSLAYQISVGGGGGGGSLTGPKIVQPVALLFRKWSLSYSMTFKAANNARIGHKETLKFIVQADVQDVTDGEGEDEAEQVNLSSGQTAKHSDPARNTYFTTLRARDSIGYAVALAAARLQRRARCVEIEIQLPIDAVLAATLRKNATINHALLPNGTAAGKIIGYEFGLDGANGAAVGKIRIGCSVGRGGSVTVTPGTPTYCSADALGPDVQVFTGGTVEALPSIAVYEPPVIDDATEGTELLFSNAGVSLVFENAAAEQEAVLSQRFIDREAAISALNEVHTRAVLTIGKKLAGGQVVNTFTIPTVVLKVPQTVNLE